MGTSRNGTTASSRLEREGGVRERERERDWDEETESGKRTSFGAVRE